MEKKEVELISSPLNNTRWDAANFKQKKKKSSRDKKEESRMSKE